MEYQYFSISLHKISNTKNNDYNRLLCTKPLAGLAAHQPPMPAARTDQWRLLYCLLCSRRPLCVYFISLYRQSDDSDHCLCHHHLAEHFLPQAGGPTLVSQRRGPPRKQCGRPHRAHRTRHRTDRGQRLWSRADRRRQLEGKDPRRPPRRKRHEGPRAQHRLHHHHHRGSIRSKTETKYIQP